MGREICCTNSDGADFPVRFTETFIPGAFVIDIEPKRDDRGFFARSFSADEFAVRGLNPAVTQTSISFNVKRGTLRGRHYQCRPHGEAKLVRCLSGSVYDVIVDLRAGSPTAKQWFAVELSAANYRMIYIPEGCAHGFQTLADNSELHYQMSEFFHPESTRGFHWSDGQFDIPWPIPETVVSQRDQELPLFQDTELY
jgi:dTDP-4-dehydrorhamnose 3,5-epimerase